MLKKIITALVFIAAVFSIMPPLWADAAFLKVDKNSFHNLYYYENEEYSAVEIAELQQQTEEFLIELESQITVRQGGGIYNFNNAKANESIEVGAHAAQLFIESKTYKQKTGGAFNPAVYNSTILWGFSPENADNYKTPRPSPAAALVNEAKELADVQFLTDENPPVNNGYIRLINTDGKYFLIKSHDGIKLDFGGIAKGYATDYIYQNILKRYANLGAFSLMSSGFILGNYVEKDGNTFSQRPYPIYVENPRKDIQGNANAFLLNGVSFGAITTSSDLYRSYTYDGKIYSHIISPFTGRPADSGVISATIIAQTGIEAEVYSTAAMVLGLDKAVSLFNKNDVKSLIVTADYKYYITGGLEVENISGNLYKQGDAKKNYNVILAVVFTALSVAVTVFLIIKAGKNEKE